MSCGVGRRRGSDLVVLWLWCMLAAAALIRPLAWQLPYAIDTDLKKKKKNPLLPISVVLNLSDDTLLLFILFIYLFVCFFLLYSMGTKLHLHVYILFICFLGPHPQHMEVPRLVVESEMQLLA